MSETPSASTVRSSESEMDVETPSTSAASIGQVEQAQITKRKVVDVDGTELPDPKRMRAAPDNDVKKDAIKLLIHWHEYCVVIFRVNSVNRIDTIADITSLLWTVHSKLRQEANNKGSLVARFGDGEDLSLNGITTKWGPLKKELKNIAAMYGFKYETTETGRAKTGTLGSLLALFDAYRPRFNEVRVGTTSIVMGKGDNTVNITPISTFGLRPEHAILTTGCSYSPTLQSSMKMSLGPMTIAINLCMQTDRIFQEAWKKAFTQVFKLFPNSQEIANLLAGSRRDNDTVMGLLADIALWGTTRASNKAHFPFAMVLTVCSGLSSYTDFFNRTVIPNVILRDALVHPRVLEIDFSGAGAFRFYGIAKQKQYAMRATEAMTIQTQQEMLFHAVWGTQKEDLGLLEWMTGHRFQTRREIGKQLTGRGAGPEEREFKPIPFRYVCKLASASQTDFLTGGRGQISRGAAFSGKCQTRVNIDGALFKTLVEVREEYVERANERAKIISKLNRVKASIAGRVNKDPVLQFGTTEFYHFHAANGYGEPVQAAPVLTNRYFYGQEED